LPNEHIALSNLRHGKAVVERFLLAVAQSSVVPKAQQPNLDAQLTPIGS
jgi:hypothetical protein